VFAVSFPKVIKLRYAKTIQWSPELRNCNTDIKRFDDNKIKVNTSYVVI